MQKQNQVARSAQNRGKRLINTGVTSCAAQVFVRSSHVSTQVQWLGRTKREKSAGEKEKREEGDRTREESEAVGSREKCKTRESEMTGEMRKRLVGKQSRVADVGKAYTLERKQTREEAKGNPAKASSCEAI